MVMVFHWAVNIIFLFTSLAVFAEVPWKRYDLFDFSGGLNNGISDIKIADNEASDLQNVVLSNSGNIKTRGGYDNLAAVEAVAVDSYVKLYLECEGVDASTTFTDTATGKVMTAAGNAQIDTVYHKEGLASGLFDGTTDYITALDSDDWDFGTDDFTVDFWIRSNSIFSSQIFYEQYVDSNNYIVFWQEYIYPFDIIRFQVKSAGIVIADYAWYPTLYDFSWRHMALIRNGSNLYLFIGGQEILATITTAIDSKSLPNLSAILSLGAHAGTGVNSINGWIDNFRVSKGIAKWTTKFDVNFLSDVDCLGLKYFAPTSNSKYLIGIFNNNKIYKMDYATGGAPDGIWDDITGAVSFSADQNDLSSFAIGQDTLIIEDGISTTAPYKWTSTGNVVALGGGSPNATMVTFYKNMAFAAGSNTAPSTFYYSNVGDITNWTTGLSGNETLDNNDGSIIRGMTVGYDGLYIWKDSSIWRLSGTDKDTFSLQRVVSGTGTLCGQSIATVGNEFIFVDQHGDIILYDGGSKIRNISSKIDGTLTNIAYDRLSYCSATVYDNDYYVSFTTVGGSQNSLVLVFDTFNLAWTKFSGMNINAMEVIDNGIGKDILIFGGYNGIVYNYPEGTNDDGIAINAYYQTKQFRFPEISPEKYLKLIKVFTTQKGNYNIEIEVKTDYATSGITYSISLLGKVSLWDTAIWDIDVYADENLIIGRIEPYVGKDFFQLYFYNSNLDEPIEIKGLSMFVEESENI